MITWWWVILNIPGDISRYFILVTDLNCLQGFNRLTLFLEHWSNTSCLGREHDRRVSKVPACQSRTLPVAKSVVFSSCKPELFLFETIMSSGH